MCLVTSPSSISRIAGARTQEAASLSLSLLSPEDVLRAAVMALASATGAERVTLGLPTSTNNTYANSGDGRHKTSKYLVWRNSEAWTMRASWGSRPAIAHPVVIGLAIPGPKRMDSDNAVKPYFDAMQDARVLEDDKHVIGHVVWWCGSREALGFAAIAPVGEA